MSKHTKKSKKSKKKSEVSRREKGSNERRHQKRDKGQTPTGKEMAGVFTGHRQGFGFVKVDSVFGQKADVFIPPHCVNGALTGERVRIRIAPASQNKRRRLEAEGRGPSGEVVQILERKTESLVGVLHRSSNGHGDYIVEVRLDGFPDVRIEELPSGDYQEGDLVELRIKRFPSRQHSEPLGEITRRLGAKGEPQAEERAVLIKHHISETYPEAAVKDASVYGTAIDPQEASRRTDLRQKILFTIDGAKARDFDDAVGIEALPDGGFKLYVAIADVAHYVKKGTALDDEAYRRATSVYFPTRAIHMLPENLSAGLCSLVPNQDRLAMVAEMDFDRNGARRKSRFYEAVFHSKARLTYDEVDPVLEHGDFAPGEPKVSPIREPANRAKVIESLKLMKRLQAAMYKVREARGSLEFELPEAVFVFDGNEADYDIDAIIRGKRLLSHRVIEEFMIAANEAVSEHLTEARYNIPYRIHEPPDAVKIQDFLTMVGKIPELRLTRDDLRNWATPGVLARILEKTAGLPQARLIHHMLLTSLKLAVYSPDNKKHFGLGSEAYSHFTSPIRRYPDLMLHRALKAWIAKVPSPMSIEQLKEACDHCSAQEQIAVTAERDIVQFYKVLFMSEKLGETFPGRIVRVTAHGFFVELDPFFVDGFVMLETLPPDRYGFDAQTQILRGERREFGLGDAVQVQVVKADLDRRRLDFAVKGQHG